MSYDPNQPQQPPNNDNFQSPSYNTEPPYGQPPQATPYQPAPPYEQTQYSAPPSAPGYVEPKRSLRWLWITLGIVGGIAILACGGGAIAGAMGVGFFAKTIAPPIDTANQYYQALEKQDYTTAYSKLNIKTLSVGNQQVTASQQAFTQAATAVDTARGKVSTFHITNTQVNNNNATITVNVTRNNTPYDVQLQLQQGSNGWKITDFNNI